MTVSIAMVPPSVAVRTVVVTPIVNDQASISNPSVSLTNEILNSEGRPLTLPSSSSSSTSSSSSSSSSSSMSSSLSASPISLQGGFIPLINFPIIHQLVRSRWFHGSFIILILVYVFSDFLNSQSNPFIAIPILIFFLSFLLVYAGAMERRIATQVIKQFEFYFLIYFLIEWIYSAILAWELDYISLLVAVVPNALITPLLIFVDAYPNVSLRLKCFFFFIYLCNSLQYLLNNFILNSHFNNITLCIIQCSDIRSLSFSASLRNFIFFSKYFHRIIISLYLQKQYLVVIQIPIKYELCLQITPMPDNTHIAAPPTINIPIDHHNQVHPDGGNVDNLHNGQSAYSIPQSNPRMPMTPSSRYELVTVRVNSMFPSTYGHLQMSGRPSPMIIRCTPYMPAIQSIASLVRVRSPFDRYKSTAPSLLSPIAAPTSSSFSELDCEVDLIHFRPLFNLPAVERLVSHRAYHWCAGLLACFGVWTLLNVHDLASQPIFAYVLTIVPLMVFFEVSRMDRSLLLVCLSLFDWWFLFLQLVASVIIVMASPEVFRVVAFVWVDQIDLLFLFGVVYFIDAHPRLSRTLKITIIVALMVFCATALIQDRFFSTHLVIPVSVCLGQFCTDTQSVTNGLILSNLMFLIRYVIRSYLFRSCFFMIQAPVELR